MTPHNTCGVILVDESICGQPVHDPNLCLALCNVHKPMKMPFVERHGYYLDAREIRHCRTCQWPRVVTVRWRDLDNNKIVISWTQDCTACHLESEAKRKDRAAAKLRERRAKILASRGVLPKVPIIEVPEDDE